VQVAAQRAPTQRHWPELHVAESADRLAPTCRAAAGQRDLRRDVRPHERERDARGIVCAKDFERRDPECAQRIGVGCRVHV
jgi:hypothetical protein